jgi:hypothetical protein
MDGGVGAPEEVESYPSNSCRKDEERGKEGYRTHTRTSTSNASNS